LGKAISGRRRKPGRFGQSSDRPDSGIRLRPRAQERGQCARKR
jgi:hypothetical protein